MQRERVGKLEQERRASLELQSASEQLSKQRDSLQSEVEALRNELKAREEKNRELEASTRARDASLESLRKKLSEAESRTSKAEQAVLDRRASLEVAEDQSERTHDRFEHRGRHSRRLREWRLLWRRSRAVATFMCLTSSIKGRARHGTDESRARFSQPFWCDADEAGTALSQAEGTGSLCSIRLSKP